MRLKLHAFLTLDGVVQAPVGPGEDRDGGISRRGWTGDGEGPRLLG